MDFSSFANAIKDISDQREEAEAAKQRNKPFAKPMPICLNVNKNEAENKRQKNIEELSHRARVKKVKEIDRSTGYYDKIKAKEEIRKKEQKKAKKIKKQKKEHKDEKTKLE